MSEFTGAHGALQHPNGPGASVLLLQQEIPEKINLAAAKVCRHLYPFPGLWECCIHVDRVPKLAGWESSRCSCDPRCWWRGRGGKYIMHAFHLWDTLFMCQSVCISNNQIYVYICMVTPPRSTQVIF